MKKLEQIRQESKEIKDKIDDTEERLRQLKNQEKKILKQDIVKRRKQIPQRNSRPIEHDNKRRRISYKQSHKSSTNSFKRLFANNATSFFLKLENRYNSNHTFSLPMYPIF